MEKFSFSEKQENILNTQKSLEQIEGVSDVEKVELGSTYFDWAKNNLSPEIYETIKKNSESVEIHKYKYISDGLSITGYIWTPKETKEPLPIIVWNRGGTRAMGSIGNEEGKCGPMFLELACDLAQQGAVVVASEYRGGFDSEGKDEWGGSDLDDVVKIKEIADKLPICKSGKAIVAGHSRGGMMSYLLASKEPWVKGVISIGGTTDLVMSAEERPEMQEIFEECFGGSEEEKKKRSATYFYEKIPKELPMLIIQGFTDERVSVEQVRKLNQLLKESDHNVEYHELLGAGHTPHSIKSPYRKDTLEIIKNFLKNNLSK